jgi:hypothetical protein
VWRNTFLEIYSFIKSSQGTKQQKRWWQKWGPELRGQAEEGSTSLHMKTNKKWPSRVSLRAADQPAMPVSASLRKNQSSRSQGGEETGNPKGTWSHRNKELVPWVGWGGKKEHREAGSRIAEATGEAGEGVG